MRIGTYLALVVRRVWAKKGILFGSFLGATLVIALLVVVPLYEASVQAVDLGFTIENALSEEVEAAAFSTMNDYDGNLAGENTATLTAANQRWLQPWYPTIEERTQTREFVVIPSGDDGAVDFLAQAEAWRMQLCAVLASGSLIDGDLPVFCNPFEETLDEVDTGDITDPADLPQPPYPRPPREPLQVRVFTAPNLPELIDVVDGTYTDELAIIPVEYRPVKVMLGERVAALAGVEVGDTFFLKPFSGLQSVFEYVEVAAVVKATQPTAAIWGVDDPSRMVYFDQTAFDQLFRAVPTSQDADPWLREARGLPGIAATQRWRMPLEAGTVTLEDLTEFSSRLGQFRAEVARESGGTIPTSTPITHLIDDFTTRSVVIGGPILAMLALVVGGAIYFLVYTSALTVEREGPEIALLKSRGASSAQTVGIHLGQSVFIAAVAALLAPVVARFLVGVTGRVPPLSTLTGGEPLDVAQVRSVVPFMVAGGVVTFLAMGVAIVPYARRGVLALRSLATRPGTKSVWQRYNIDLFAIALSLVMLAQLRLRGFIDLSEGEATLDPLAIVVPALLLFTGALILLRLFPYVLRLTGWILTKPRSMSTALTGWHLGRNPVPYGRLALLVWVTTGLGAFALTYAATLNASYTDRAEYAAGADVRVVGDGAGYAVAPEGSIGTPVLRTDGSPRQSSRRAEVLAVRPDAFSQVVTWREDFGAAEPADLFDRLRPGGRAPDVGVEVPADADRITVDGVVVPQTLRDETETPYPFDNSMRLLMRVIDNRTRVWTMIADVDFVDTQWTTATIDLTSGKNTNYNDPPEPPLTIASIWLERSSSSSPYVTDNDRVLMSDLMAVDASGSSKLDLTEMTATGNLLLTEEATASEAARERYREMPAGQLKPDLEEIQADPLWRDGDAQRWVLPANRTRANTSVPQLNRVPDDVYVLLDREAAAIAGLDAGSTATFSVGSEIVAGEVVGFVENVPTASDRRRQGVMVMDLDAINATMNGAATWSFSGALSRVQEPQELWVGTDDPDGASRVIVGQMRDEPEQVWTIGLAEAAFSSRPVQVGLVAILFVGAATGVVLALAGVTGYVLLAVSRRAREMGVLRALGFERTNVGVTFALEQFVVIGLGAAIGLVGGVLLVYVMLPFFQLGETAEEINPSILLSVPGPQLAAYVLVVGALLIISVLWATRRVSATRMSEVLREVER